MRRDPWEYDAACATTDPEAFFSADTTSAYRDVAAAKAVCAGFPVRAQCLELGFQFPKDGIFGGFTATERKQIKKRRRAA